MPCEASGIGIMPGQSNRTLGEYCLIRQATPLVSRSPLLTCPQHRRIFRLQNLKTFHHQRSTSMEETPSAIKHQSQVLSHTISGPYLGADAFTLSDQDRQERVRLLEIRVVAEHEFSAEEHASQENRHGTGTSQGHGLQE